MLQTESTIQTARWDFSGDRPVFLSRGAVPFLGAPGMGADEPVHFIKRNGKTIPLRGGAAGPGGQQKAGGVTPIPGVGLQGRHGGPVEVGVEANLWKRLGYIKLPTANGQIDPHLLDAYKHALKDTHEIGEFRIDPRTGHATAKLTPKGQEPTEAPVVATTPAEQTALHEKVQEKVKEGLSVPEAVAAAHVERAKEPAAGVRKDPTHDKLRSLGYSDEDIAGMGGSGTGKAMMRAKYGVAKEAGGQPAAKPAAIAASAVSQEPTPAITDKKQGLTPAIKSPAEAPKPEPAKAVESPAEPVIDKDKLHARVVELRAQGQSMTNAVVNARREQGFIPPKPADKPAPKAWQTQPAPQQAVKPTEQPKPSEPDARAQRLAAKVKALKEGQQATPPKAEPGRAALDTAVAKAKSVRPADTEEGYVKQKMAEARKTAKWIDPGDRKKYLQGAERDAHRDFATRGRTPGTPGATTETPTAEPATSKAEAPKISKADNGISKAEIQRQLIQRWKDEGGQEIGVQESESIQRGNPFIFRGKLPGDIESILEGRPQLRQIIHVAKTDSERINAAGPDVLGEIGIDRYLHLAEQMHGSNTTAALEHARNHFDPEVKLLAAIHDNMQEHPGAAKSAATRAQNAVKNAPTPEERQARQKKADKLNKRAADIAEDFKPKEMIHPDKLEPGHEATIHGIPVKVETRGGVRMLTDGGELPDTPLDAVSQKLPIDKGSLIKREQKPEVAEQNQGLAAPHGAIVKASANRVEAGGEQDHPEQDGTDAAIQHLTEAGIPLERHPGGVHSIPASHVSAAEAELERRGWNSRGYLQGKDAGVARMYHPSHGTTNVFGGEDSSSPLFLRGDPKDGPPAIEAPATEKIAASKNALNPENTAKLFQPSTPSKFTGSSAAMPGPAFPKNEGRAALDKAVAKAKEPTATRTQGHVEDEMRDIKDRLERDGHKMTSREKAELRQKKDNLSRERQKMVDNSRQRVNAPVGDSQAGLLTPEQARDMGLHEDISEERLNQSRQQRQALKSEGSFRRVAAKMGEYVPPFKGHNEPAEVIRAAQAATGQTPMPYPSGKAPKHLPAGQSAWQNMKAKAGISPQPEEDDEIRQIAARDEDQPEDQPKKEQFNLPHLRGRNARDVEDAMNHRDEALPRMEEWVRSMEATTHPKARQMRGMLETLKRSRESSDWLRTMNEPGDLRPAWDPHAIAAAQRADRQKYGLAMSRGDWRDERYWQLGSVLLSRLTDWSSPASEFGLGVNSGLLDRRPSRSPDAAAPAAPTDHEDLGRLHERYGPHNVSDIGSNCVRCIDHAAGERHTYFHNPSSGKMTLVGWGPLNAVMHGPTQPNYTAMSRLLRPAPCRQTA